MQTHTKHKLKRILSVFLFLSLLALIIVQLAVGINGSERHFSGAAEEYYRSLLSMGFPSDYATQLTELHLLHPNWTFLPLEITKGNSQYTWDYVISKETENPETNLISSGDSYADYRHPTNKELYDSGYYQASVETVSYFMDARNFLNETDIFLFYDLSTVSNTSLSAVEAVLQGTFMENAVLENGMTYAKWFCELGNMLGINPVYLAAKVRQEQGTKGTSPTISGKCGDKLWEFYRDQTELTDTGKKVLPPASGESEAALTALNGYYNFFNVSASGNGVFSIYKSSMLRAKEGTESMRTSWGTPSWNTKWKSLYGGAELLKTKYIDRYQATVYLQKFNVDSRSDRNFWGQYMQAVSGGLTEAHSLYRSFAAMDTLDLPATFLIPIYEGMPQDPCADPANGKCTLLAQSTNRYSYRVNLSSPTRVTANSESVYIDHTAYTGGSLQLSGDVTHSYGIKELQFSWDNKEWQPLSSNGQIKISLPLDFLQDSSHILVIRGKADYDHDNAQKKNNSYFLCAVVYVTVTPPPQVTLSLQVGNVTDHRQIPAGTTISLPASQAPEFAGWLGSDGSFLPSGADCRVTDDLCYTAIFLNYRLLPGASVSTSSERVDLRFSAVMDTVSHQNLSPYMTLFATVSSKESNERKEIHLKTVDGVNGLLRLDAATSPLTAFDYTTAYSASFYATLHYTNGESRTFCATGEPSPRSACAVASAALSDPALPYSSAALNRLRAIAECTNVKGNS